MTVKLHKSTIKVVMKPYRLSPVCSKKFLCIVWQRKRCSGFFYEVVGISILHHMLTMWKIFGIFIIRNIIIFYPSIKLLRSSISYLTLSISAINLKRLFRKLDFCSLVQCAPACTLTWGYFSAINFSIHKNTTLWI